MKSEILAGGEISADEDDGDADACVRFEPEIIERVRPGTIGILTATGNERVRTRGESL